MNKLRVHPVMMKLIQGISCKLNYGKFAVFIGLMVIGTTAQPVKLCQNIANAQTILKGPYNMLNFNTSSQAKSQSVVKMLMSNVKTWQGPCGCWFAQVEFDGIDGQIAGGWGSNEVDAINDIRDDILRVAGFDWEFGELMHLPTGEKGAI